MFWRHKAQKKESKKARSASFACVGYKKGEKIDEDQRKKLTRSKSVGHKTSRSNSFIHWFKTVRECGNTLKLIGDKLEGDHSQANSSQSLYSGIKDIKQR